MPSSRTPALHKHDPHNPTSYPVSSQQAPGRGVTAHISWLMGCDAQKRRMTCSRSNGWEGAELESAPSSASSSIEISYPSSQALEATVSHSHFPKSSTHEGQTNGWPWAQHCGSTFTIGAHDNPLRKQEKPLFLPEDTQVREGGWLARSHKKRNQILNPQESSDHMESSWWGKRVLGLEYPVKSLTSAVWVGCYAWCIGLLSTQNTQSRKPRWVPTWWWAGNTSRELQVTQGLSLLVPYLHQ